VSSKIIPITSVTQAQHMLSNRKLAKEAALFKDLNFEHQCYCHEEVCYEGWSDFFFLTLPDLEKYLDEGGTWVYWEV